MLVLRAIVDQEQQPGSGQALDQAIEQGLGLGINPVQVLKDQQQRLLLALAQQHALQGLQRALAALGRIERAGRGCPPAGPPGAPATPGVVLEGLVQRQHLPGDLGPDGPRVVVLLHVAVALEQVNHREVRRGLAIGHRGAFEHEPPWRIVRVDELIDQARLPHPGLPDHRHDLAMAGSSPLQGLAAGPPAPSAAPQSG